MKFATSLSAALFIFAVLNMNAAEPPVRLYSTLYDPGEHTDRDRVHVKAPTWETFENRTQLITLRGFPHTENVGRDFEKTLDKYVENGLGRVVWPNWRTIYFENLDELAATVKEKNLYLFNFWGYVPGSGEFKPGVGSWLQFRADPEQFRLLEKTLGDRWLGMDNGEQDGRYISGYSPRMHPISGSRFDHYLHFQRHFQQLSEDLGDRLSTLVSLNFGHYFLKEGVYTLIGAETAQALPNSQVYYSYIRGAGKQYGVLWFGNASVFNRWGWKSYGGTGERNGPEKGTSLVLLKRLMYSHILYNCAAVGFESGWFLGDGLSPIGNIQQSAGRWIEEHGSPGVLVSQVALIDDFHSGWSFPRHLYTGNTYRVWGNIPYGPGDYLNNNILGMFFPRYEDCSYFHDETGFMTATPYSDSVDCLLSDARDWLLRRYPLVVVSGTHKGGPEIKDKLTRYVEGGGRLVLTAGNIDCLPGGFLGVTTAGPSRPLPKETGIVVDKETVQEQSEFSLRPLNVPEGSRILATCDKIPVAFEITYGKGSALFLASPFGVADKSVLTGTIPNKVDTPLDNPYPMLEHVRKILDKEFRKTVLFEVGEGLGSIVCRKEKDVYTVGIFNNELHEKPFEIVSKIGKIDSIRELQVDSLPRETAGLLPLGFDDSDLGKNSESAIAGGDVRIFEVKLSGENVAEIPHQKPPKKISNRFLSIRPLTPVKEEILARPTFCEHYDGVMLDWRYFELRSDEAVAEEAKWLRLQGLKTAVDFSSGINLFPDLRLIENDRGEYEKSMARISEVLKKAVVFGAEDVILATHRVPENNYTADQTRKDIVASLKKICQEAAAHGMTVSLRTDVRQHIASRLEPAMALVREVGEENMKLAVQLWCLEMEKELPVGAAEKIALVMIAAPLRNEEGIAWTNYGPLSRASKHDRGIVKLKSLTDVRIIFDAVYRDMDEEYFDAVFLK